MSVKVGDRHESGVQFIDTARELLVYCVTHCVRFPKRYKEYLSIPIVQYATRIYEKVKTANSIYATKLCELDLRVNCLDEALGLLYTLTTMIDIVHDANIQEVREYNSKKNKDGSEKEPKSEIKDSTWIGFAELINKEITLVKAVKRRDKENYKRFT